MKIRAQIGMVLNLDKCIGCHTCSVTCKNVWTSRPGMEYAWFNNVETKPGIGYPKEWENQDKWNGGWVRRADGSVVVEAVAVLRVAADHVRGLEHDARDRVVDAAARARDLRAGGVDDLFLRVVHHHHARLDPLAHHRPRRDRAVDVEQLHPVVVLDPRALGVVFAQPDDRAAPAEREHQHVVGVRAVNAPLLVRGDEVQRDFLVAVGLATHHLVHRLEVDRGTVAR